MGGGERYYRWHERNDLQPRADLLPRTYCDLLVESSQFSLCKNGQSFTDVAADAYYIDAVLWAVKHKITVGTTLSTFSPDEGCTRAQIVTFLYRAHSK